MIKSFFIDRGFRQWSWLGTIFLLFLVGGQVYLTLLINEWYGGFYDLLQQGGTVDPVTGMSQFWQGIVDFCYLAAPYMGMAAITNWFARVYSLRWRQAINDNYIPIWLITTNQIEGASQRIQEDCAKFAEAIQGLGLQFIRALFTLMVFIPLLWGMIGWLVWVAVGCTAGGMIVSWFVGWWLPGLEYNNQKTEAAFRKQLVLYEDKQSRESGSISLLAELFTGLRLNHQRLYMHYGYFDLWVGFYSQAMSILPYLVAGPMLIIGTIKLGALIQISNAFSKVSGSMSIFIDNWPVITAARSVYKRLHEFEGSLM